MTDSNPPPSYAPISTTSFSPSNKNVNVNVNQQITKSSLIKTPLHKSVYDSMAEIYSIITTLEVLENSFLKDYITDKEKYTSTSLRLIHQYQIILKNFTDDARKLDLLNALFHNQLSRDLSNFLTFITKKYDIFAPLAVQRLGAGVPATIEHFTTHVSSSSHPMDSETSISSNNNNNNNNVSNNPNRSARLIAETTGNFITCMDALKLNYKTKGQLHPLLSDLVVSLNDLVNDDDNDNVNGTHKALEFSGKSKLVNWLIKLNNLSDSEELLQDDIDTFLNDLDFAYKSFYESLE